MIIQVQRAYFVLAFFIGHTRFVHPNGAKTGLYHTKPTTRVEKKLLKVLKN
jgi:hypothetical protein